MKRLLVTFTAAFAILFVAVPVAHAQCYTVAPAPVVTYRPAPVVTTYRPAPVVTYRPAPVVTYRPVPAVPSYRPVYPAPVVTARPVIVDYDVYVPGQPLRNVLRAITP